MKNKFKQICKSKSQKVEQNLLKTKKENFQNLQENLNLAMKKVGQALFHFIIFVLKTTSMYFDVTYYYYYYYYYYIKPNFFTGCALEEVEIIDL